MSSFSYISLLWDFILKEPLCHFEKFIIFQINLHSGKIFCTAIFQKKYIALEGIILEKV